MTVLEPRLAPAGGPARVDVLRTASRWSRRLAVVAVGGTVALAAAPVPAEVSGPLVLAVAGAGLLLGLPHGAVDHLVAARLARRPWPVVALAYAAVAAVSWVLLATAGPVALVAVLLLSVVHFGLGELEVVREVSGWRPGPVVSVAVALAGAGALLLPLARAGPLLVDVGTAVSPGLGPLLGEPVVRAALAATWVAAAALATTAALRAGQRQVAADVLVLGLLGAVVPPLAAFALWFGGWHGLRHCARLLLDDQRCASWVAAGDPARAVRVLAGRAAWPTLAATAVLAALLAGSVRAADPSRALATTLLLLLALTVPHMLVVLWSDHRARHPGRLSRSAR